MGVNLTKGGNVSLIKAAEMTGLARLSRITVGCGWDINTAGGRNYDLDLSVAGLGTDRRVPQHDDPSDHGWQEWFVWANHRHPANHSINFTGDNRTGAGDGDDETILVNLDDVPDSVQTLVFAVIIWRGDQYRQHFGNVQNAFIRIYDQVSGTEIARYDLGTEFADETLVMFGELYRYGGDWKFRAVGQGYSGPAYQAEFGIRHTFHTDYARYSN
ncbi:MAG: TerD family protein [Candidatus Saccharimonas sp.]